MEHFTPYSALAGGVLIGIAATGLLWLNGRIAGISGIAGGVIFPTRGDVGWRVAFLIGLVAGTAAYRLAGGALTRLEFVSSPILLVAGGLLIGFGAGLGGGCTSGHGVCGLARVSPRSMVATTVFTVTAAATVFAVRHLWGGP